MHIDRRPAAISGVVLVLGLLAGCVKHDERGPPASFPARDGARMPGLPACPDLEGVFSSAIAEGSDARLARIGGLSEPRSSAIQITREGASVRIATWWPPKTVLSEANALRHRDRVLYGIWWNAARDVLRGELRPGSDAAARASSVPDPTAARAATWVPECEDGWMRYATSIFLARDVEGGLLVRQDEEVDRVEIPLMCGGDGCAGIPLHVRYETRWARHAPSTLPATWSMDFDALPVPDGSSATAGDGAADPAGSGA
ncbi:MAG: hypothetical protein ACOY37_05480 [Pseudomonadota bacterium]